MRQNPRYAECTDQARRAEEWAALGHDHWNSYRRVCECGKVFYAGLPHAKYCSEHCQRIAERDRRRLSRIMEYRKYCEHCGKLFAAERSDAKYCSTACKQAAYRGRRRVTDNEG